ncbi:MAG TPA: hypothetical protein DCG51_09850, partial [Erysipelotrichaceae bacterium]|nr:hypothetical protein [Erysipelotrichaceae bacterium]
MPKKNYHFMTWLLSFLLCFNSSFSVIRAEEPVSEDETETQETAETLEAAEEQQQETEEIAESEQEEEPAEAVPAETEEPIEEPETDTETETVIETVVPEEDVPASMEEEEETVQFAAEQLAAPEKLRWATTKAYDRTEISAQWSPVEHADYYLVSLYNATTDTLVAQEEERWGTSWTIETSLEGSTDTWYFTVQAKSDSADYSDSEVSHSKDYVYGKQDFNFNMFFIRIFYLNETNKMPYTYNVNGEQGDISKLSFEVDRDGLNLSLTDTDLCISAEKDGKYIVYIVTDDEIVGYLEVEVLSHAYSVRFPTGYHKLLHLGKEYALDFNCVDVNFGSEGDYSALSITNSNDSAANVRLSDDGRQLLVTPLNIGSTEVTFYAGGSNQDCGILTLTVHGALPEEGPYLDTDLQETAEYQLGTYFKYAYYYVDGVDKTDELKYEFTTPGIADWDTDKENSYELANIHLYCENPGETDFLVKHNDEVIFTQHCVISLPNANSVSVFSSNYTLKPGETQQLIYTTDPQNAKPADKIEYVSDNDAVAGVSSEGLVTAVSVGTAKITATLTMSNGNVFVLEYHITVSESGSPIQSVKYEAPGKYIISFAEGYPSAALSENPNLAIKMLNKETGDIYSFPETTEYAFESNSIVLEESFIRIWIQYYDEFSTLPAGNYEWIVSVNGENYAVNEPVQLVRDISVFPPELIASVEDDNTVRFECTEQNDACSVYMSTLYENRYSGVSGEYTRIFFTWQENKDDPERRIRTHLPDTKDPQEYIYPLNDENGNMIGIEVAGAAIDALGLPAGEYEVYAQTKGYYAGEQDIYVTLASTEASQLVVPENIKIHDDGTVTFDLHPGTHYIADVRKRAGTALAEAQGTAPESGKVTVDLHEAFADEADYISYVRTSLSEDTLKTRRVSYTSAPYHYPPSYVKLDVPTSLVWNEFNVSWNTVANTNEYELVFIDAETGEELKKETVTAAEGASTCTCDLNNSITESGKILVFKVKAIATDTENYRDSEFAESEPADWQIREFSIGNFHLDVLDEPSGALKYTYTVNGKPGDPSELTFVPDNEGIADVIIDKENQTIAVNAHKYAWFYVNVKYQGRTLDSFYVDAEVSDISISARRMGGVHNNVLRVGTTYTYDVTFKEYDHEGDYSQLEYRVEDGYQDAFELVMIDDHERFTI